MMESNVGPTEPTPFATPESETPPPPRKKSNSFQEAEDIWAECGADDETDLVEQAKLLTGCVPFLVHDM